MPSVQQDMCQYWTASPFKTLKKHLLCCVGHLRHVLLVAQHYMTVETTDDISLLESMRSLNQCQMQSLEEAGRELDPSDQNSCAVFNKHVANVQATIVYNFKLTSFRAMRKEDPGEAAAIWLEMKNLCEKAMTVLQTYKDVYPFCGTSELYDFTLACWSEAEDRRRANAKDAECMSKPIPA